MGMVGDNGMCEYIVELSTSSGKIMVWVYDCTHGYNMTRTLEGNPQVKILMLRTIGLDGRILMPCGWPTKFFPVIVSV